MTERGRPSVSLASGHFQIGKSALTWDGNRLTVDIHERAAPLPWPVRGRITLTPHHLSDCAVSLHPQGRHRWWPIAPSAEVEVNLSHPELNWRGQGYFDTNTGDAPLETDFKRWDWSRGEAQSGSRILYDLTYSQNQDFALALAFDHKGNIQEFEPPPRHPLPKGFWGVKRGTQSEQKPRLEQTLEDSPFYVRSVVSTTLLNEPTRSVHESLDLNRFQNPIVKTMLPFRMPRFR